MTAANRLWITVSLLAIVAQLASLRGFDFRILLLFVIPVVFALSLSSTEPTTRGVVLARVFLTLLGIGLIVSKVPWLFPGLGGLDPKLPVESDLVLAWYVAIYLIFITGIVPLHLFTDSLRAHREGRPAQFSRPTCYLGLLTVVILLPGMIMIAIEFLHFFPIV